MLSPYVPAIMLFGIYPKELKTYVHTKTSTWRFVAAWETFPAKVFVYSMVFYTWGAPEQPAGWPPLCVKKKRKCYLITAMPVGLCIVCGYFDVTKAELSGCRTAHRDINKPKVFTL